MVTAEVKAAEAARVVGVKGLLLHLLKTIKLIVKVAVKVEGAKVVGVVTGRKRMTSKVGSLIMIKMTIVILRQFYSKPHNKILASHNGIKTNGRTSGIKMCKKMIVGMLSTKTKAGLSRRSKMSCKNT